MKKSKIGRFVRSMLDIFQPDSESLQLTTNILEIDNDQNNLKKSKSCDNVNSARGLLPKSLDFAKSVEQPKGVYIFNSNNALDKNDGRNTGDTMMNKSSEHIPNETVGCKFRSRSLSPCHNKQKLQAKCKRMKTSQAVGKPHTTCVDIKRKRQSSSESDFSDEEVFNPSCWNTSETSDYESMLSVNSPEPKEARAKMRSCSSARSVSIQNPGMVNIQIGDYGNATEVQRKHRNQGHTTNVQRKHKNDSTDSDMRTKVQARTRKQMDRFKEDLETHGPPIETKGYLDAKERLRRPNKYRLVPLIGKGDGATFISMMLLRELSERAKPYVLNHPDECVCIDTDEDAVVVIPDASGITAFYKRDVEKWMRCIQQEILPASRNITVIITMKWFPESDYSSIVDEYSEYVIDLTLRKYRVSDDTKRALLTYNMHKHGVWLCMLKRDETLEKDRIACKKRLMSEETFERIVDISEKVGFVKRVSTFFDGKLHYGSRYFSDPRKEIVDTIKMLPEKDFFPMIVTNAHNNHLTTDDIEMLKKLVCRRHLSAENVNDVRRQSTANPCILQKSMMFNALKSFPDLPAGLQTGIRRLEKLCLLEKVDDVYMFAGDAVKNSFLIVASEKYPSEVISTCDEDFLYRFVGPQTDTLQTETDFYISIDKHDRWSINAMMDRAKNAFLNRTVKRITQHPMMGEPWFFDSFLRYLKKTPQLTWKILQKRESDSPDPYCVLYYGMEMSFRHECKAGEPNNITESIIQHGKWKQKRSEKVTEDITLQENRTLDHAAELNKVKTFKNLVDMGVPITSDIMITAIKSKSAEIVKFIVMNKAFQFDCRSDECYSTLKFALIVAAEPTQSPEALDIFQFLARRVNVNYKTKTVQSLIHIAASKNDPRMVRLLASSEIGADLDLVSTGGKTALMIAAHEGYSEFTKAILEAGADQRRRTRANEFPIHIAAANGRTKLLSVLIESNPLIVTERNKDGRQPLHLAVICGHVKAVQLLLRSDDVDVNSLDKYKTSPLHLAAIHGHTNILELLIKGKAQLDVRDAKNYTPLSTACNGRHYESVKILLNHYASRRYKLDNNALVCAVEANDRDMVGLLLQHGYNINNVDETLGAPINVAMSNGCHEMMEYLLQNNADVNIEFNGLTPVHLASKRGDIKMLKTLIFHGANIAAQEKEAGDTIAHIVAASKGKENFMREVFDLHESVSLVDIKNKKRQTALHTACQEGNVSNVKVLLESGFSITYFTSRGVTPTMIAEIGQERASITHNKRKGEAYHEILKLLHTNGRYPRPYMFNV